MEPAAQRYAHRLGPGWDQSTVAGLVALRTLGQEELIRVEAGMRHLQRIQDALAQQLGVLFAAHPLDDCAKRFVIRIAVGIAAARLRVAVNCLVSVPRRNSTSGALGMLHFRSALP